MKKAEALFVALAAGTIAFAFAFILPSLAGEPVAWYYPLDHRWAFEVAPTGLAMDFYGRLLQALAAWAITVMIVLPIARRFSSLSVRLAGLVTAWAITAVLLVTLHYAWTLHFRRPVPAELPRWYQPR